MERRRRTAPRLAGLVVCAAALPALLLSACGNGSGGSGTNAAGKASSGASGTPSASATTTRSPVPTARFSTLPNACKSVTSATVSALVPKAKEASGHAVTSSDPQTHGICTWTGNGSNGYQFRWLSVTLQRFVPDPQLGSGDDQATKRYTQRVQQLSSVKGFTASSVNGVGDQASSITGRATIAKVTSQNDTFVARLGNVVLIVEYDGAGLVGQANPSASTIDAGGLRVAKDVLAAVSANQ